MMPVPTLEPTPTRLAHWRHEWRTPLNALLGYSEMLQEDAPAALGRGFAELHHVGAQLLALVNRTLDEEQITGAVDLRRVLRSLQEAATPLLRLLETLQQQLAQQCARVGARELLGDLEKIHTSLRLLRQLAESGVVEARTASPGLTPPPPPTTVSPVIARAPARLLVVDDNEANRDIFRRQLCREGHHVTTAADGIQALQCLCESAFDVVLLDVLMPGLNGYQVLAQMKAAAEWREIPVLMISALDELSAVVHCLERGAEDYLAKPFDSVLLRVRLNSCLEKKRLRDQLRGQLRALQNELDIAAGIQQSILPSDFPAFPAIPEFDLFATMIPAREVGGDFYDFFLLDEDRVGLVIGDVSGKGVPASLFMAVTRTMVKSMALSGLPPGECLQQVNRLLVAENRSLLFVTLSYAILNFRTGEVTFSNAGHHPALRLDKSGGVTPLVAQGGIVLGIVEDACYPTSKATLQPGDQLLFYTDGVSEAQNSAAELFTEERLYACLQQRQVPTPEALLHTIATAVRAFSGTAPQADDLTMLAVAYHGSATYEGCLNPCQL
ncbi:MAG: SpoIIE family protein phosphatase [Blastocatellia bacterium]